MGQTGRGEDSEITSYLGETLNSNMQGNIITSTGPAPLFTAGSDLQWALSTFDDNLYWVDGENADSKLFPYESSGSSETWQTLAEWQVRGVRDGKLGGQDKRSVVADPQFTNAAQHDYRLKQGSPALSLGFKQIDMSKVGPRSDRDSDKAGM